jgi:hypothetical protein
MIETSYGLPLSDEKLQYEENLKTHVEKYLNKLRHQFDIVDSLC